MKAGYVAAGCLALGGMLAGCGGGGAGGSGGAPTPSATAIPTMTPTAAPTVPPTVSPTAPPPTQAMTLTTLELAQSHVLPESGKRWTLANASESLHFVGGRDALALVVFAESDAVAPVVEGWLNDSRLGEVALDAPSLLPPTEAGGPAYASDRFSATVPAAWMQPGLQLRVRAQNYLASAPRTVNVGADMSVTLRILPFYLFGADNNTRPYAQTAQPDAATVDEVFAKWPVAQLSVVPHPAVRIEWPALVIAPSGSAPAYVMTTAEDQQSGFQVLRSTLGILQGLLEANGESPQAVQYYGPVIQRDMVGNYRSPGGGVGALGGDTGVGDDAYRGVFIHEQGHAMGLPHVGEAYDDGKYPYFWGSLNGSAWGYDSMRSEFLAPPIPVTASTHDGCDSDRFGGNARAIDSANRCIKQDPMQSGSGDQHPDYRFATFSDYSTAMMQRHMETRYTVADSSFVDGYKRWDLEQRRWSAYTPATTDNAQYGFNGGFPVQRDVPVYAIALTISHVGTPGATQIYPPIPYTGNLVRTIDPTDPTQRAEVRFYKAPFNGNGAGRWFCSNSGCDYTLRVRYANGVTRHVMLQGAFRAFDDAGGAFRPNAGNANLRDSFKSYVVNVPNDAAILDIELLDTPMAWDSGLPSQPGVLASR